MLSSVSHLKDTVTLLQSEGQEQLLQEQYGEISQGAMFVTWIHENL